MGKIIWMSNFYTFLFLIGVPFVASCVMQFIYFREQGPADSSVSIIGGTVFFFIVWILCLSAFSWLTGIEFGTYG